MKNLVWTDSKPIKFFSLSLFLIFISFAGDAKPHKPARHHFEVIAIHTNRAGLRVVIQTGLSFADKQSCRKSLKPLTHILFNFTEQGIIKNKIELSFLAVQPSINIEN